LLNSSTRCNFARMIEGMAARTGRMESESIKRSTGPPRYEEKSYAAASHSGCLRVKESARDAERKNTIPFETSA
jgi:hypothetical protein